MKGVLALLLLVAVSVQAANFNRMLDTEWFIFKV